MAKGLTRATAVSNALEPMTKLDWPTPPQPLNNDADAKRAFEEFLSGPVAAHVRALRARAHKLGCNVEDRIVHPASLPGVHTDPGAPCLEIAVASSA